MVLFAIAMVSNIRLVLEDWALLRWGHEEV